MCSRRARRRATCPRASFRVDLATLKEREIGEWIDLPMWILPNEGHDGITRVDPSRALAYGMRYRPLSETVTDTLRWALNERGDAPLKAGLTPEREADALASALRA